MIDKRFDPVADQMLKSVLARQVTL